ncbi:MAG: flagellin [Bacteriovoracia bacterium]
MGLRVSTNVQSLGAQRHLNQSNDSVKRSQEKLASGSRITRAADDAAGLAISEGMRAQIRSMRQDVRNANDGISLIQTAEGGMNEIGNIMIRLRELSIQAASDTIGDTERGFIDKEVQAMTGEIDRISRSTEFNGRKLLTGEGSPLEVQVGLNNIPGEDRFVYDTAKINTTSDRLGVQGMTVASKESAQNNLEKIDMGIKVLTENRAEMGALQNRLQATVNNLRIYDENLSAARSQIYDVDMATEVSELTKSNILSTAGVAVLSQANHNSESALKLL